MDSAFLPFRRLPKVFVAFHCTTVVIRAWLDPRLVDDAPAEVFVFSGVPGTHFHR